MCKAFLSGSTFRRFISIRPDSRRAAFATTPTNLSISGPTAVVPVSFHVFLPAASATPPGGFPLIIYGHGLGDSQFGAPTFAAATWAKKGFATLAIEITGHGFGALSTTQIATAGGTFTVATPGRGIQFSSAPIGATDGCILPNALATRDCSRQTAVDLFALVRTIKATNGLGLNLNTSRIYYTGQSFRIFLRNSFRSGRTKCLGRHAEQRRRHTNRSSAPEPHRSANRCRLSWRVQSFFTECAARPSASLLSRFV